MKIIKTKFKGLFIIRAKEHHDKRGFFREIYRQNRCRNRYCKFNIIDDTYLVQGRDFQSPPQSVNAIKHYASPDYVTPPLNQVLLQSIKNLQFGLNKSLGNLSRQIQPIVKIMNELAKEENEQKDKWL